jgi:hypothetical protein
MPTKKKQMAAGCISHDLCAGATVSVGKLQAGLICPRANFETEFLKIWEGSEFEVPPKLERPERTFSIEYEE